MPKVTKQSVLTGLTKKRLATLVQDYEVSIATSKPKNELVAALVRASSPSLRELLESLNRAELKALCVAHDLDTSGREKAVLVARLLGQETTEPAQLELPSEHAKATSKKKASKKKATNQRSKQAAASTATLGFEQTLWQAADKLRNNMDAAEYKHVVLGLIFLKYISDAFDDKHKALEK